MLFFTINLSKIAIEDNEVCEVFRCSLFAYIFTIINL
jgi:hypothetical protein